MSVAKEKVVDKKVKLWQESGDNGYWLVYRNIAEDLGKFLLKTQKRVQISIHLILFYDSVYN